MDTQTACKACRLGFLILEPVTQRSPNRCAQQLGLGSILGTRTAIPDKEPTLPLLGDFLLNQTTKHQATRTKQDVRMLVRESGLNV